MAKNSSDTEMGAKDPGASVSNSNFYIEEASTVKQDDHPKTAHRIDHDPWYQLGLLLAVSFNCGYILGFSDFIMKPLGWVLGPISMAVLAVISVYANWLLAKLHIIDGRRFIRYRDLMGYAFGRKMYYVTWTLQFLTFILGNMGFLVLSGRALKEIYMEYDNSSTMTLQEFIIISGVLYFVFAFLVPNLSAMKIWCGISTFLTFIYILILMKISISDGMSNSKDYKLHGTRQQKIFNGFNGIAAIIFASNSGMVPELQATLRQPAVKNMHKALYFQFTIGLTVYYTVTIIGYWAYGSSVSDYLLDELSGPKWAKILANVAVYLQVIVSQHMFCSPVHEALDTRFSRINEKDFSLHNMLSRFILRFSLFTVNTFVAAMLPFLGDFVNLMGSLSLIPLTFIFPSLIFLK
ncbi:hypothetical protein KI387_028253, partial [Taxus chinensis]